MTVFGNLNLAIMISVIACCIGGVMGGLRIARPHGLKARSRAEERAFGGMLILAHAGAAMGLGYAPSIGRMMAGAVALGWLGAAAGRVASLILDREKDPMLRQALILELLMALALALPWLGVGAATFGGAVEV
ncbi:DUF4345 family protein [Caulobacter sp. NIBR1757]|uniref:DUF4345 family protein n=1 Tax=Caulobacter sp. NIBR1757 TaxID=3016000 RepID=UPI0022F05942|nr:DUF4345 family protein [Caulobacter sp. NIBR1757]WGM37569.1 hypothetical protein AMEJIAPC_00468 [Caulobacter sp. NIBR1757]